MEPDCPKEGITKPDLWRESIGKKAKGRARGVGTFVKLRYAGPIKILSCWMTYALEKVIS